MDKQIIQTAAAANKPDAKKDASISFLLNTLLDREGFRKRFDELLGERSAQFVSSVVSLVNADINLQKAFRDSPITVIQAALKAATYDLPIDTNLGYAYIVPFNNNTKTESGWVKRMEANFILGYKGMIQLCLRTGAYERIPDAVDVRQGELIRYDRLTGDCEFKWVDDEEEREKLPVIGYAGYFRLKNGAEKTIYMTVKQIEEHEKKNRKGQQMGKGWRDDFDSMARKTIIRRLCGKYGLMSITYQNGDKNIVNLAQAVSEDERDYDDSVIGADYIVVDDSTGEVEESSTETE